MHAPAGTTGFAAVPLNERQRAKHGDVSSYYLVMPGKGARNNQVKINLKTMEFEVHLALRRFSTTATLEAGAQIFPPMPDGPPTRFSLLTETWVLKFSQVDGAETSDDDALIKAKFLFPQSKP